MFPVLPAINMVAAVVVAAALGADEQRDAAVVLQAAVRDQAAVLVPCFSQHLAAHGPTKASDVAAATGIPTARTTMADDHYGWFTRTEQRGIYTLTEAGRAAIDPA